MPTVISDADASRNIAETIKLLKRDRSFADIAKLCCTSEKKCYPGDVEKMANERNSPRPGLLARVAEALGTTTDAMIHGHLLKAIVRKVGPIEQKPAKARAKKTKSLAV